MGLFNFLVSPRMQSILYRNVCLQIFLIFCHYFLHLLDYARDSPAPTKLTFGLAWDVTSGKNIDLDASAICFDSSRTVVDTIYFRKLISSDFSIRHGGDEREGDEIGDDEKIYLDLDSINPEIKYVAFVINSYSGEELDDVRKTSCHLFDTRTKKDLATYNLSNNGSLDGYTGLVVACLYRQDDGVQWSMRIISEAAQGKYASDLADEVQRFLLKHPTCPITSSPPEPDIVVNTMPEDVEIELPPM